MDNEHYCDYYELLRSWRGPWRFHIATKAFAEARLDFALSIDAIAITNGFAYGISRQ
jgi:hypothetical protein